MMPNTKSFQPAESSLEPGVVAVEDKPLSDEPTLLELPTDHTRSVAQSFRGARYPLAFSATVTAALKILSQRAGANLFTVVLAAFKTLLHRYTGQTDILMGVAHENRQPIGSGNTSSSSTGWLPLRTNLNGNPPFHELLRRVHQAAAAAHTQAAPSLEQLASGQDSQRLSSHPSFPQVMFSLQEDPLVEEELTPDEALVYELALCLRDGPHGLSGVIAYNAKLFEASTIAQLSQHLLILCEDLVAHPEQQLSNLLILTAHEQQQLLVEWNNTRSTAAVGEGLHQLFEEQVECTPDAIALIFDAPVSEGKGSSQQLTYGELNRRANQVAQHLTKWGVGPEVLTGICMERSVELVIGLLAILKAGGAYVPLDPVYPGERIAFMLADTAAPVVLTQQRLLSRLAESNAKALCLDADWNVIARAPGVPPRSGVGSIDLAYVIYTSGSTGRPKGVAITHRNAVALLNWAASVFPRSDLRGVLAATSICFDLSVYELFLPLSLGGTIILAENALRLPTLPSRDAVTLVNTVPSAMTELIHNSGLPASVGTVNLAGEPLKRKLVQQIYAQTKVQAVYNLYGPSEDTTYSTFVKIARDDPREPSIGRPIANTQAYILDAQLHPVPIGVVGQLYLGGDGISRGYLNRPELTAERYVPDPFGVGSSAQTPGARLYRTGDLARYRPDGNIEFLGRLDHQVKIRGFRIELGEVEAVLSRHPAVREALVTTRDGPAGDKQLIAYLVFRTGQLPATGSLRCFLKEKLPGYMVPSAFVVLDTFPLTPNGKINRQALPPPDWSRTRPDQAFVAPRHPIEKTLAAIWSQVLQVEQVSIHDNFFDLGGHSLLITRIVSRLNQEFHVDLSSQILFEHPTIAELAHCLTTTQPEVTASPSVPLRSGCRAPLLPLSFSQQQFWFMNQLLPDSPLYNVPTVFHLAGDLNVAVLERCLHEIVRRHETLRTTFVQQDNRPVQVILPLPAIAWEVIDLRSLPDPERHGQMQSLLRQYAKRSFDLRHGPLLQATLFRLAEQDYQLLLNIHHIATDGWSTGVIMADLKCLYEALIAGDTPALPELPIQYADFTCWQRQILQGDCLDKHVRYWQDLFADQVPFLALLTDRARPAVQSYQGDKLVFPLSTTLLDALTNLGQQNNASLFMVMLAAFQLLLHHYTGQTDLVVATATASRGRPEVEDLIGAFVNTLPIRTDLSGDPTFAELVRRVRQRALEAFAHQELPIEKIVEALNLERTLSHHPLFQVMFDIQNLNAAPLELANLRIGFVEEVDTGTAKLDLIFSLEFPEQGPVIFVEYNTDIFEATTVQRLARHFQVLLENVVAHPDGRLSEQQLLTRQERAQLLVEWNTTRILDRPDACLPQLFETQVAWAPDASALVFADQSLTYSELNRRANQLAHYLQANGVGPEIPVCLCLERSAEMVIALLGILKAGGTYVPVDPAYPAEHLARILEDACPTMLLTQKHLRDRLPEHSVRTLCLDADWINICQASETNPDRPIQPDNAAYVIYTSGSTGRPKGVVITQRALVQYVVGAIDHFVLTQADRVLQFASISFDAAAEELYPCLLCGATLVLRTEALLDSIAAFAQTCITENITLLDLPTAYWHTLLAEQTFVNWPPAIRLVIIGGEQANPELLARWHACAPAQVRLVNTYGPTETTIVATACDLAGTKESYRTDTAIGRPVSGVQVYVLNSHLQPVPIGVAGELYIGGAALSRGYLNHPELTAEKFIPNPFAPGVMAHLPAEGLRLYRTGDLVRYLPDGNLEFLGRVDHQVKIRGYRVELGEIEAVLQQHPQIQEVVVEARLGHDHSEKQIVAYLVPRLAKPLELAALRDWLKARLPAYMLPAMFVTLEALPLTSSKKIDRRALPEPDWSLTTTRKGRVPPRTPIEQALASVWSRVLGVQQLGVYDNFFELGGHSLLAAQIAARLRHFLGQELTVRLIFEAPTIAALADRISAAVHPAPEEPLAPIQRVPRDGPAPLSFGQQQLWLTDQLTPGTIIYNSPFPLRLVGPLDIGALQASLTEIMRRHQVLRTTFLTVEGQPFQIVREMSGWEFPIIDLGLLPEAEREAEARRLMLAEVHRSFNLSTGPLLRVFLIQLASQEYILLLILHHIVFDGWSVGILFDELGTLYRAFSDRKPSPLPALALQYADYACWQQTWMQGEQLERRLAYWKQQLQGAPAIVSFPLDRARPRSYSAHGAQHPLSFSKALSDQIQLLSQQAGVTLFMTLLATLKTLIYRYTEQTDVVIGTVVANRQRPEIEGLIGYFINTLALRTRLQGEWTFLELLQRVRETALGAYAHQELPFDKLVETLQTKRDLSYNPFFQVMFILQNTAALPLELPGIRVTALDIDPGTTQFVDMSLILEETAQGLSGFLQYNTDLFEMTTIRQIQADYKALLESVVANPNQKIASVLPIRPVQPRSAAEATAPVPTVSNVQDVVGQQRAQLLDRRSKLTAEKQLMLEKRLKGHNRHVGS